MTGFGLKLEIVSFFPHTTKAQEVKPSEAEKCKHYSGCQARDNKKLHFGSNH